MELFSEIYSCYYQVLRHLLCSQKDGRISAKADSSIPGMSMRPPGHNAGNTIEEIRSQICEEGFAESMLSIIPKLESGAWNLFEKKGELYLSKLTSDFLTPLSLLEKSYLKALLPDPRIRLFLNQEQIDALDNMLASVTPLWQQGQFLYYDRFADGDPYENETYRSNFRILLQAQKQNRYVDLDYNSPNGNRVHHYYVPARLEYSVKNDKFRLLALKHARDDRMRLEILNIARIQSVLPTDRTLAAQIDLNAMIQESYYKEPLRLHILNRRNALERAMLHFANYEKNTRKIDENTYECLIYYNQSMETELLIEVMSFGPMLKVMGNERFLNSLKTRLRNQMRISPSNPERRLYYIGGD